MTANGDVCAAISAIQFALLATPLTKSTRDSDLFRSLCFLYTESSGASMSSLWQASSQLSIYGSKHFGSVGYRRHFKGRESVLDNADLSQKTVLVVGGDKGIGFEVASYAADKGARVVILCESRERGVIASQAVCASARTLACTSLVANCSSVHDIKRAMEELAVSTTKLDMLVFTCGDYDAERTVTVDGLEAIYAAHLLAPFACLKLALPLLRYSDSPRVVLVSSAALYTAKWDEATNASIFNAKLNYARVKRGQLLLVEVLSRMLPEIRIVAAHPGWVRPSSVPDASALRKGVIGDSLSELPLLFEKEKVVELGRDVRTQWQGAAGVCWLLGAPDSEVRAGAFYLDGKVQPKHMAGPFFTEGWATKNSDAERATLVAELEGAMCRVLQCDPCHSGSQ
jgi:NAD(P)-dependent dehydrogenase (short-subunit alcohol dehydrogenase family)